ncbi:hypothetical protein GH714_040519 [Hevea brasiliensis]|uniref:PB1 domain-containing protein n=1 Tax=Hevea brasiliensis TaxID=3981 RepID=A0A6A6L537_HEVBR|nr:hypothetical protein GH714_040519 [Hevea brasiliensis]
MIGKLAALCGDTDISFKYQLPGEDLDALISVTNDDDLEHMMHEDRFVEALNSGPSHVPETNKPAPNNVDFLFGLDKGVPPPPAPVKVPDLPETYVGVGHDDRVIGSDPLNVQTQLQRMQIREQEQQTMYRKNSDDNLVGGYPGEYYVQKLPDKLPPATLPVTVNPAVTTPAGYWPEKQFTSQGYQPAAVTVTTTPAPPEQQQVYVLQGPAPGTVYHTPVMRPVTGQTGQQYYMRGWEDRCLPGATAHQCTIWSHNRNNRHLQYLQRRGPWGS